MEQIDFHISACSRCKQAFFCTIKAKDAWNGAVIIHNCGGENVLSWDVCKPYSRLSSLEETNGRRFPVYDMRQSKLPDHFLKEEFRRPPDCPPDDF